MFHYKSSLSRSILSGPTTCRVWARSAVQCWAAQGLGLRILGFGVLGFLGFGVLGFLGFGVLGFFC